MTPVTSGRVNLAVDLVAGQIIATVDKLPVRTFAVFDRRLDFQLVGVAVVAEGAFVTAGA